MEEKILTPDQVAQILQIHPFTVLKFIKQGKLRASKLGRVYRIRASDVELFLESQVAGSKGDSPRVSKKPAKKVTDVGIKVEVQNFPELQESSPEALLLGSEAEEEALPSEENTGFLSQQTSPKPSNNDQPFDHYILD